MRLARKSAIVTGAGSGFGAAIARLFAAEGARVVLMDIDGPAAASVAASIGPAALAVEGDVTRHAHVAEAVAAAAAHGGAVDIVVNNAGWSYPNQKLLDTTEAEFDRVFATNVKSVYHMVTAVVPVMRMQGGGCIINIGSTGGIRPRPGLAWYNATKAAVNLVSSALAAELAPDRIRVNCVAPVMGATGLLETFMGLPDTPENRARFLGTIPLGRLSEGEDIAQACLYLASEAASFITGIVLPVDGGRTI